VTFLAHTGHHLGYAFAIASIVGLVLYDFWRRRRERN